jgi:hypothetical protein
MWDHVNLVKTDVTEKSAVFIFMVEEITRHFFAHVISFTLKIEATGSSETSVSTRSTQRHIPEGDVLHSHCRENLKPYIRSYLIEHVWKKKNTFHVNEKM